MKNTRLRSIFFIGFATILFLLFQNFSFIKDRGKHSLEKFLPNYQAHEKMMGIEVPHGYNDYVAREIASKNQRIIFDEKKLLKDTLENSPVYKEIKDFIDPAQMASDEACSTNPAESENNCYAVSKESGPIEKTQNTKLKLRGNPLRGVAGVAMRGPVTSEVKYDQKSQNVLFEVNGNLSENTKIRFEVESQKQEGKVQIDMSW